MLSRRGGHDEEGDISWWVSRDMLTFADDHVYFPYNGIRCSFVRSSTNGTWFHTEKLEISSVYMAWPLGEVNSYCRALLLVQRGH